MGRTILGAVSALLLAGAGLFWWQGRAATNAAAPPPPLAQPENELPPGDEIPTESGYGLAGESLPEVPEATREGKRFNRFDRDRDNLISRAELLQPRIAAFRKLDSDHNNLLSFEEWSVATSGRFRKADANADGVLNRQEFATTRPKAVKKRPCKS